MAKRVGSPEQTVCWFRVIMMQSHVYIYIHLPRQSRLLETVQWIIVFFPFFSAALSRTVRS